MSLKTLLSGGKDVICEGRRGNRMREEGIARNDEIR